MDSFCLCCYSYEELSRAARRQQDCITLSLIAYEPAVLVKSALIGRIHYDDAGM